MKILTAEDKGAVTDKAVFVKVFGTGKVGVGIEFKLDFRQKVAVGILFVEKGRANVGLFHVVGSGAMGFEPDRAVEGVILYDSGAVLGVSLLDVVVVEPVGAFEFVQELRGEAREHRGFLITGKAASDRCVDGVLGNDVDTVRAVGFYGRDYLSFMFGVGNVHADEVVVDDDVGVVDGDVVFHVAQTFHRFLCAAFPRDVVTAKWTRDMEDAEDRKATRCLGNGIYHRGGLAEAGVSRGHEDGVFIQEPFYKRLAFGGRGMDCEFKSFTCKAGFGLHRVFAVGYYIGGEVGLSNCFGKNNQNNP